MFCDRNCGCSDRMKRNSLHVLSGESEDLRTVICRFSGDCVPAAVSQCIYPTGNRIGGIPERNGGTSSRPADTVSACQMHMLLSDLPAASGEDTRNVNSRKGILIADWEMYRLSHAKPVRMQMRKGERTDALLKRMRKQMMEAFK